MKNMNHKTIYLSVHTIAMQIIIILAFTLHLFIYTFSGRFYLTVLFIITSVFVMSKSFPRKQNDVLLFLWYMSICIVIIGYFRSGQSNDALMDLITLLCGLFILRFSALDSECYKSCLNLICLLAAFFSIGVLLQKFIYPVYIAIVRFMPSEFSSQVLSGIVSSSGSGYRGFSTNTGFTAGYICAGILSLTAELNLLKKAKLSQIALMLLYIVALLYTGKRGTTLFVMLSIVFCYLIQARGRDKFKIYWRIFIVILVFTILFTLFGDVLATALTNVPFISEVINTINGLSAGEDVTSMRLSLYIWALRLFISHPIIGIGWATFRTTVVGNVSQITSLEVHNIYLQLLCETGLIGFVCIVTAFLAGWFITMKAYCNLTFHLNKDAEKVSSWQQLLFFSFLYQTFFLLYGLTANVLYDQHYQIMYMFSCSIVIAYRYLLRKGILQFEECVDISVDKSDSDNSHTTTFSL